MSVATLKSYLSVLFIAGVGASETHTGDPCGRVSQRLSDGQQVRRCRLEQCWWLLLLWWFRQHM